jgi:hypothetical protein
MRRMRRGRKGRTGISEEGRRKEEGGRREEEGGRRKEGSNHLNLDVQSRPLTRGLNQCKHRSSTSSEFRQS